MCSVLIEPRFKNALMRYLVQALLYPADVFAGIPEYIVLRADADHPATDTFDFDLLFFLHGMTEL